jgi:hypothetical protein
LSLLFKYRGFVGGGRGIGEKWGRFGKLIEQLLSPFSRSFFGDEFLYD